MGFRSFWADCGRCQVVEIDVTQEDLFQIFAACEVVALHHVLDVAVETLGRAVGLRAQRRRPAMLNAEVGQKRSKSWSPFAVRGCKQNNL